MSILSAALGLDGLAPAVAGVTASVSDIVKRFVPDPDKALEAKTAINAAIAQSLTAQVQASQSVMEADAKSDSWFTRAARPTVVYWSLAVVTVIMVAAPFGYADAIVTALAHVPDKLWDTITTGVGIFTGARSAEKIATTVFKK